MKDTILAVTVSLFIVMITFFSAPVIVKASGLPIPNVYAPDPRFDFSSVPEGREVSHSFLIRNTGRETLEIIRVETT